MGSGGREVGVCVTLLVETIAKPTRMYAFRISCIGLTVGLDFREVTIRGCKRVEHHGASS